MEIPKVDNNLAIAGGANVSVTGLTLEEQKKLLTVLKEVHPTYASYVKTWKMYLDAYKGGSYVKNYIYQHLREGIESVKKRRERSVYPNYVRPIISLYLSYIFRRKIVRSSKPIDKPDEIDSAIKQELEIFWKNADGHGTAINKFMKKCGIIAKIFGHVGIIVDMPETKTKIITEKDRKDNMHSPYLAIYTPIDIVNWETDEKGNLLWVRILEEVSQKTDVFIKEKERGRATTDERLENLAKKELNAKDMPLVQRANVFFSRKGSPIKRYTTWTKDEWITHEIRPAIAGDAVSSKEIVDVVSMGIHDIGEVPMVFLYNEEDAVDPIQGISFLQDIAPLNIMIMNWLSMLDEEIFQKTLNILVMQEETGAEIVIGSNNVLTYAGDQPPGFIAPASTPGELIQASIEKARDEIYRLAKLTGGVGVLKEVRSGVAYSYEFQETEQTLADTADEIEDAEIKIHRIWCKWMGTEWQGVIDYPDEFGIEDVLTDLKVLESSIALVPSPTFKAEVQKKIVPKVLQKASEETISSIEEEIDQFTEIELEKLLNQIEGGDANQVDTANQVDASGNLIPSSTSGG
jgi:hypothetical protein